MPDGARRRVSRRVRRRRTLLGVVVLITVGIVLIVLVPRGPQGASSDSSAENVRPTAPVAVAPASLDEDIRRILEDAVGFRVGVALADVEGIRTFGDDTAFFAASTAKILTAGAFYHLVETGEADLDEPLGDYDARFQLEAMVNSSSNDAWLLLMGRIGHRELSDYAASIGVTYDPEENLLTPAEMASVLTRLSAGELLDPVHTEELLGFMQDTNDEDLIPAASREDIAVHHKYGQLGPPDGDLHDAALLTFRGTTIALVVYTENRTDQFHDVDDDSDEDRIDEEVDHQADQIELIHALTRTVEDALYPVDP